MNFYEVMVDDLSYNGEVQLRGACLELSEEDAALFGDALRLITEEEQTDPDPSNGQDPSLEPVPDQTTPEPEAPVPTAEPAVDPTPEPVATEAPSPRGESFVGRHTV